ncbi:hypothetical protein AGOR_G00021290 [Albula goreensis]|uniref:Uncharacterized protein n=1 Tax=Albula goreensis TaxID=1534307 RepID=A0A8T3E113_9TELE|nr:hypothetical protein AGOR_G00021290 [Albula goreensis]
MANLKIEDTLPPKAACKQGKKMESENKRRKYSTSSNDSDTTDSHVTTWSKCSKNTGTNSTWVRQEQKKPSEVFRTDFITAMKLPDSAQLSPEEFYVLSDPWRQEWEKGVQVPANVEAIPEPVVRVLPEVSRIPFYSPSPSRGFNELGQGDSRPPAEPLSQYDLDDLDVAWLELVNAEFRELALPELDELTMERVVMELESQCQDNMQLAIETEEGLGIEYDEDVVCDVCRSPEGEDGNEMVFCDKCNICVHQACYGILKVPLGNWLCRTCALGVQPKCLLCPKRGGALKPTRSGTKWVHVSCALWIPEVSIGCPEKMEPITKVSHIPASRWALSCSLCREHTGTCIQCSMPSCIVAFHVTCAFDHGLEMRTILAENDEVRFKSYCLEHSSTPHGSSKVEQRPEQPGSEQPQPLPQPQTQPPTQTPPDRPDQTELEKASQRKQKLQELRTSSTCWKSNFNQPLITLKRDEVDNLAQQEQDVLYRRLKLFTHLRQDLERVRNLCYMVTRREKMKHSLCDLQERIFHLQIQLLQEDLAGEKTLKGEKGRQNGVKERGKERRKSSPEKKERWKSSERENGLLLKQLGFSKTFPLDGTLFDGWLAQSVQITTDDMLSQWSLDGEHRDKTAASLLSDQLLQGEESLLNLMMNHSMKSTWKTPHLGRKTRGKPRPRGHKPLPNAASASAAAPGGRSNKGLSAEKGGARRVERSRSKALHHHHHHHPHPPPRGDEPEQDPPQPPISKMDSCHISEQEHEAPPPEPSCPVTVPKPAAVAVGGAGGGARATLRLRLSRQGKSRPPKAGGPDSEREGVGGKDSSLFDAETDGYFSDAEQSDSDTRSGSRKLGLGQLHAGKEDVLRRSVLAS